MSSFPVLFQRENRIVGFPWSEASVKRSLSSVGGTIGEPREQFVISCEVSFLSLGILMLRLVAGMLKHVRDGMCLDFFRSRLTSFDVGRSRQVSVPECPWVSTGTIRVLGLEIGSLRMTTRLALHSSL